MRPDKLQSAFSFLNGSAPKGRRLIGEGDPIGMGKEFLHKLPESLYIFPFLWGVRLRRIGGGETALNKRLLCIGQGEVKSLALVRFSQQNFQPWDCFF